MGILPGYAAAGKIIVERLFLPVFSSPISSHTLTL
jgi:hypothetical protein